MAGGVSVEDKSKRTETVRPQWMNTTKDNVNVTVC